jgi:hypothetical protein
VGSFPNALYSAKKNLRNDRNDTGLNIFDGLHAAVEVVLQSKLISAKARGIDFRRDQNNRQMETLHQRIREKKTGGRTRN